MHNIYLRPSAWNMRTHDLYLNIYAYGISESPDLLSRDDVSGTENKIIWPAAVHSNTIAWYIGIVAIYSISTVVQSAWYTYIINNRIICWYLNYYYYYYYNTLWTIHHRRRRRLRSSSSRNATLLQRLHSWSAPKGLAKTVFWAFYGETSDARIIHTTTIIW